MDNYIKIIDFLNDYILSIKRNKNLNVYIDSTTKFNNSDINENIIVNENNTNYLDKDLKKRTEKELIEYDLFGNVTKIVEDWKLTRDLDDMYNKIHDCQKCPLGQLRKNFVFGDGNVNSDIVFIGEAPGKDEDEQGKPFVGRAGQLLTKIIESVGLKREDVYICNILKSRPPNNRTPMKEEIDACKPYLDHQLKIINPKFIIALGKTAAETLLGVKKTMNELRGILHTYNGIRLIVTYHPAALLRNPHWKLPAWEDMKFFKKLYEES